MPAPHRFGYSPFEQLEDRPHVMVDGAARRSSVLTLSHWPHAPSPLVLAHDLSVGIVLRFWRHRLGLTSAGRPERAAVAEALARASEAEAVTNDHFDEDGLMAVFAMMEPEIALRRADLVLEVASCGDFGVVSSKRAAAVSFAVAPLAELEAGSGASTSERYLALLPRVEELLSRPEDYEALWGAEMGLLEEGRAALERGAVELSEQADDLAVVSRAGGSPARLPGAAGALPIHAAAVHSATSCGRILCFDGPRCELYLRYESWVRYVSRRMPLRPELGPLALELSGLEPGGVTWEANGSAAIVARLRPGGEGCSELAPEVIAERVHRYLATAPPAWDPFASSPGALAGRRGRRRPGARR